MSRLTVTPADAARRCLLATDASIHAPVALPDGLSGVTDEAWSVSAQLQTVMTPFRKALARRSHRKTRFASGHLVWTVLDGHTLCRRSPLHRALYWGNIHAAARLLEAGAAVNLTDFKVLCRQNAACIRRPRAGCSAETSLPPSALQCTDAVCALLVQRVPAFSARRVIAPSAVTCLITQPDSITPPSCQPSDHRAGANPPGPAFRGAGCVPPARRQRWRYVH